MTWDSSSGYAFNSGSYSDFEQPKAHNAAVQGGEGWGCESLLPRGRAPRVKGEDCDLHEVRGCTGTVVLPSPFGLGLRCGGAGGGAG